MAAFIGLWFAQIVFGAIVYFTNPKRNDISDKAQNARNLAIYAGLVPCIGFMLFLQICWLILYRIAVARESSLHRRYQGKLETSFGLPSPDRTKQLPAGDSSKQRSDNPFL